MEKIAIFLGRCALRTFFICTLMCQPSFIMCDEQQEEISAQQQELAAPQEETPAPQEEVAPAQEEIAPQEEEAPSAEQVAPQESNQEEAPAAQEEEREEFKIPLTEDLMREHGILRRLLLIYEDIIHRIDSHTSFAAADVYAAADLMKKFIEEYHEALEEEYLFPIFEKNDRHVALIKALRDQHTKGRKITNRLLEICSPNRPITPATRTTIRSLLKKFIVIYRPHSAQEDTILLPEVRSLVTPEEFDALSEKFEALEHELFGNQGFEKIADAVAQLEIKLGIFDLDQFTPADTSR
jgi:hemerythrin-like domain-containing protein